MATRLVADELDLDLATLAAALLIIIVIVVDCAGACALGAAALSDGVAVGLGLVEVRRSLVVLIRDLSHFGCVCVFSKKLGISKTKSKGRQREKFDAARGRCRKKKEECKRTGVVNTSRGGGRGGEGKKECRKVMEE